MKILQIYGLSIFLAFNTFAGTEVEQVNEEATFETFQEEQAPEEQVESLTDRKDLRMFENPRNPAMVKGFQGVGNKEASERAEEY